jgi:hypothetical protein
MSDNLTLNPGSGGGVVATDDIGGVHYQLVKLAYGVLDSATLVSPSAGLPVAQQGSWSVALGSALPAGTNSIGTVVTTADTAIGSTTAPAKLLLVGGKTNDATPQYQPLPLTAGGAAVKTDGSATTQPVSGTVTANAGSGTFACDTELPAAAALADATANPTAPLVGACLLGFNGTTWDRLDSVNTGQLVVTAKDTSGNALPAMDAAARKGFVAVTDGTTTAAVDATSTGLAVTPRPTTSGGPSTSRIKSAASTNGTNVKASAGQVYGWYLYNNTSSAKFFKLYNKATSPTIGTDTPAFTVGIPPNGGCVQEFLNGIPFGTGIGYGITGGITDADTTATATDDVHGVLLYK